ncbi:unnamed protein product [Paramecium octaurelia]|uniref:VWFA domain-containing protein n=1 Tax=Paramecium octaurelia TaxID=43137 RepID=A0A8S1UWN8_PAROT|nr:unnamed protein product [Paramecium octaurelia]
MKQFYSQEIHYQVVAKLDVQEYLNNQFEKDFHLLLIQHDMQSNVGYFYFNFITILDRLQILYDKNSKEKLDDLINYPGIWQEKGISQCVQIQKAFQQLKKNLRFECKIEIDLVGSKFGQSFQDMYKGLKITQKVDQIWNNTQKFKQGLLEQYIIIDSKIEIKTSAASYNESFNYIKSPKGNPPPQFKTNFPKQFHQIMIQSQGWNRLYKELYDVIKQEIGYSKSKLEFSGSQLNQLINLGVREDDNIQSFNPYVIKSIMQKVQNNIKVKYNNEFAQYGLILTDVGERCIFYYSMLIIWRFLCYQRWNSKDIQQKHQNNYQNELIRCIAEINQDNEKKGCIKANELVNKITNFLKTQFLDRTKKEVLQKMSQQSMTNAELIAKLDKELLIEVNEKRFEDEQFKQNILSYTTDHKSYINKYTQDMLTKVQLNLLTEYSVQYRKELSKYFRSIQENAKIFYKYIEIQQKEVKTIKYFYSDADQKHNLFYENYLFKLLFQCLIGKIEDKIDIIDIQYQEIFQTSNYNPVNSKFVINLQLLNQQDQQVYNLKSFVESLIKQLDEILKKINKISIKQSEYELDVEFGKLKLQMNGCEYICPCCKRKCDQDNDNKHTHQCQNGHQIRGINGILIEKSPSLYTCEEILDECILRTLETNLKKTWKEVKMTHSTWNFKNQDDATRSKNKEKWKNVWNLGLGKLVCSYLEKQLKHQIIFKQKSEFENQASNIHYILILDDSGSMQGDKWNIAKNGALECIKQLETTDCSKVSVIIFNQESRVAEECQTPNFKEMNKKIQYMGGGTNFEHPFEQALKLVQKYTGFNKIQILFYTDGQAGYPKATIDQFCQLPQEIRQIINLRACSGEESTQSLELIISKFTNNMQSAQLRNSVQPMDIQKIWTEVVSQNIHSQLV